MDDFFICGDSFNDYLSNLQKILRTCGTNIGPLIRVNVISLLKGALFGSLNLLWGDIGRQGKCGFDYKLPPPSVWKIYVFFSLDMPVSTKGLVDILERLLILLFTPSWGHASTFPRSVKWHLWRLKRHSLLLLSYIASFRENKFRLCVMCPITQ